MMKDPLNVPVTPGLLKWAREESGLSLAEAAERAKIKALKHRGDFPGMEPWQRLQQWEDGEATISFRQIEQIAKAYRRPVLTFFLSAPPKSESTLTDYRTVGDRGPNPKDSPEFAALTRRVRALHKNIKEIVMEEGHPNVAFVGAGDVNIDVKMAVADIRRHLSFTFSEQQKIKSSDGLFRYLRDKAESIGVFIVLEGDLGSYHSKIGPEVFRGIVISDSFAPFIVVNPNDSLSARVFTLVHELVHVWLGDTGISNLDSLGTEHHDYGRHEKYCNKVAAEFLVPEQELRARWIGAQEVDELSGNIRKTAKEFKVSEICFARRLLDLRFISKEYYWDLYNDYRSFLNRLREKQKEKQKEEPWKQDSIIKNRYRLGNRLIETVIDAANDGKISEIDAFHLLRVKIDKFASIYPETA